ncbi:MAG: FkbM family methyltransferase [Lentisphaerota bacterium]
MIPDVRLSRLDTIFRYHVQHIDLIKIDAEGHEPEVVAGALQIIGRDQPVLVIEAMGDPDDKNSIGGRLFSLLADHGYAPHIFEHGYFHARTAGAKSVDYFFLTKAHCGAHPDAIIH